MALNGRSIACIIPMLNEERSIGLVIDEIPPCVDVIICVDNGSTDASAAIAQDRGAVVFSESERGYGASCLRGMQECPQHDVVCFIDGDYSDYPEDLLLVLEPVCNESHDMCIGSRVTGVREKGALLPQAVFGNWLSTFLIQLFWGVRFTDLGPMRAISRSALDTLHMEDRNFGWTVEMQIKAAALRMRCCEVSVRYRKRIGTSKISGTIRGSIRAGIKILSTIARYRTTRWQR